MKYPSRYIWKGVKKKILGQTRGGGIKKTKPKFSGRILLNIYFWTHVKVIPSISRFNEVSKSDYAMVNRSEIIFGQ